MAEQQSFQHAVNQTVTAASTLVSTASFHLLNGNSSDDDIYWDCGFNDLERCVSTCMPYIM